MTANTLARKLACCGAGLLHAADKVIDATTLPAALRYRGCTCCYHGNENTSQVAKHVM